MIPAGVSIHPLDRIQAADLCNEYLDAHLNDPLVTPTTDASSVQSLCKDSRSGFRLKLDLPKINTEMKKK
jgi:hypothetical protein